MNAQRGRLARQQARRHHRERLGGIALAVIGIAVLVIAVVALRDPRSGGSGGGTTAAAARPTATPTRSATPTPTRPATTAPSSTAVTTAPPVDLGGGGGSASVSATSTAQQVPLVVLNNTTVSGLAKQAAKRFERGGWTVTSAGNLTNDIISTCAYYDPSSSGAEDAAKALQAQYSTIKRVAPKFSGLPAGPVVVVLTPDYQSG